MSYFLFLSQIQSASLSSVPLQGVHEPPVPKHAFINPRPNNHAQQAFSISVSKSKKCDRFTCALCRDSKDLSATGNNVVLHGDSTKRNPPKRVSLHCAFEACRLVCHPLHRNMCQRFVSDRRGRQSTTPIPVNTSRIPTSIVHEQAAEYLVLSALPLKLCVSMMTPFLAGTHL